MDRKQPLILIMMITMFGIAIAGAIWIFTERNIQVRRDSMLVEISRIAADAYLYRIRPASMGGGGGSYLGYSIPRKLRANDLGTYEISQTTSPDTLLIEAKAGKEGGGIRASVDPEGLVQILSLTGQFAK